MIKSSEIKTWQEREQYATDDGVIMDAMQEEINELRKETERLKAELTICKNVMFKGGVRLRSCGVSNYTIESVADSLDLYAKGQP